MVKLLEAKPAGGGIQQLSGEHPKSMVTPAEAIKSRRGVTLYSKTPELMRGQFGRKLVMLGKNDCDIPTAKPVLKLQPGPDS